jgi:hypothetical protein
MTRTLRRRHYQVILPPSTRFPRTPRAAKGYYLGLDTPLQADLGAGCRDWVEIAINDDEHANQLARLNKRHVIVAGELGRFGSALVDPPIFIRVENAK